MIVRDEVQSDAVWLRWLMALTGVQFRPGWQKRAACHGLGPDLFFSDDSDGARAICSTCSVRIDCLGVALADKNLQGTWAGTTQPERLKMQSREIA
jgi:WhiB family transcriptional regulator, redox-sensing transcriptional regulator